MYIRPKKTRLFFSILSRILSWGRGGFENWTACFHMIYSKAEIADLQNNCKPEGHVTFGKY